MGQREDTAIYIASLATEHHFLAVLLEMAVYEANIRALGPNAGPLILPDDPD